MIVIDGLSKSFPEQTSLRQRLKHGLRTKRQRILNNVSLTVNRGELVGLLGGNGAGKTTLLQVLATLSRSDAGSVTIGGISLELQPDRARGLIGFCGSADRGFYYRLTVRENLRFFGTLTRQLAGQALENRLATVLELVDLQDQADKLYAHLSTGMRQRLAVARALIGDPPVLLFDEPTRAVDPIHADSVRTLIRSTLVDQLGKTVVLATNILDEAWSICHRVAVLRGGAVVAYDAPSHLAIAATATDHYRIAVDRFDETVAERTRAAQNVVRLTPGTDGPVRYYDVEITRAPHALSELLHAIGAGRIDVISVVRQHAAPADIFAELVNAP